MPYEKTPQRTHDARFVAPPPSKGTPRPPGGEKPTRGSVAQGKTTKVKLIGLFLGPLLLTATFLAPLPLSRHQHALVAVLAFAMTYWISEALPIPVTSLLILALCVVLEVPAVPTGETQTLAQVVFAEFSSPTLFLLIGGFLIAQSMIKHGVSRRIALGVLALPGVAGSSYRVVVAFVVLGAMLSAVMDNGAVAAMLLPIALGLDKALSKRIRAQSTAAAAKSRLQFSTALMLAAAYGPTVGSLLTPIGDPSVLIGRSMIKRQLGITIPFGEWVLLATPVVVVLIAVLCVALLALNRPEVGRLSGAGRWVKQERRKLGPMSRGEINTLLAFTLAICLWLLPSVIELVTGRGSPLHSLLVTRMDSAVVAILAASLLFVLPVDWSRYRFTMTWDDTRDINWGAVLLVGTGLTLGKFMASTGLAELIGRSLAVSVSGAPVLVYVLAAGTAILISEVTSNTASAGIVVPIVPALTTAGGGDTLTAALIATFSATYGFMLPISTSANAIIYGSGVVPITKMIRTGLLVDLSGILVIVAGVTLMRQLTGVP